MSTTVEVITGDTFEAIARKQYGSEQHAQLVADANPGVVEPLTAGTSLVIPILPGAPEDKPQTVKSDRVNEVATLVGGERFRFFDSMRITRALDTMDTVELGAPLDVALPRFKEAFRPFSYQPITITVDGDPLFKGTAVGITPVLQNDKRIISVSGYALPGVLNDCTPPASSFPLEFGGQGLRDIATTLAAPFGLSVVFDADQGPVFGAGFADDPVAIQPGERVLAFLAKLAKQRGLVISSTARGELIFQESVGSGDPVARLKQGESPLLSVNPFFSPQDFYSHITGITPTLVGFAGTQITIPNTRLKGVVRPMTFEAQDTEPGDLPKAVAAKEARMFGNMAAYNVRVATWRDPQGNLWEPNTNIKLQAPDAMIFNEYEFIIRSVDFNRGAKTESATLDLVLPGSFSGKEPESFPWDL